MTPLPPALTDADGNVSFLDLQQILGDPNQPVMGLPSKRPFSSIGTFMLLKKFT